MRVITSSETSITVSGIPVPVTITIGRVTQGKYEQFAGNVASVYANPFCHGGSANSHYSGNAKTYMDIGLAMGATMVELCSASRVAPIPCRRAPVCSRA